MGKKLDILQIILIVVIAPILMFAVIHEQRHKSIAENMGCDAEISYLPDFSDNALMYTTYNCPEDMSERDRRMHAIMQSNVETTGYQLIPVLMMTIMGVMLQYPSKVIQE